MSTATVAQTPKPSRGRVGSVSAGTGNLTFGHLVKSEWIKLWSLRSTWWSLGITVIVMAGMALIMSITVGDLADLGIDGSQVALTAITFGYFFAQIVVAVLGALIITGEYSTGMIRSTFTADPGRIGAVSAKALVLATVVFATSLIGIGVSWLVSLPMLSGQDISIDLGSVVTWRVMLGTAAYLTLVSLLSFALGVILRSSAGTIAAALGILIVLPMVFTVLMSAGQEWASDVNTYLPGVAGEQMMAFTADTWGASETSTLTWWQGGLVMFGYVAALGGVGLALLKSRDA